MEEKTEEISYNDLVKLIKQSILELGQKFENKIDEIRAETKVESEKVEADRKKIYSKLAKHEREIRSMTPPRVAAPIGISQVTPESKILTKEADLEDPRKEDNLSQLGFSEIMDQFKKRKLGLQPSFFQSLATSENILTVLLFLT